MTSAVFSMLKNANASNFDNYKDTIEEIVEEIILCGLSRSGFFSKAAFYSGTALGIFYDVENFSKEMCFSLLESSENFDPSYYFTSVRTELASCGFTMTIEKKQ